MTYSLHLETIKSILEAHLILVLLRVKCPCLEYRYIICSFPFFKHFEAFIILEAVKTFVAKQNLYDITKIRKRNRSVDYKYH